MSASPTVGPLPPLTDDDRRFLLDTAADAIATRLLGQARPARTPSPRVCEPGASFVTLRRDERLLGCIGTLAPQRALHADVAHNATAAAFDDPRMPPLTTDDFAVATVKVSVLSPLEAIEVGSEADLLAQVRPGVDGLLVAAASRRGTFLPSVWEQLPRPRDFLDGLWQKAGFEPRSWPDGLQVWRYQTDEFAATARPTTEVARAGQPRKRR